jgi:hypothetical protein
MSADMPAATEHALKDAHLGYPLTLLPVECLKPPPLEFGKLPGRMAEFTAGSDRVHRGVTS